MITQGMVLISLTGDYKKIQKKQKQNWACTTLTILVYDAKTIHVKLKH